MGVFAWSASAVEPLVFVPYQDSAQCDKKPRACFYRGKKKRKRPIACQTPNQYNQLLLSEVSKVETEAANCTECSQKKNQGMKDKLSQTAKLWKQRLSQNRGDIPQACFFASTLREYASSTSAHWNYMCKKASQVGPKKSPTQMCFNEDYISLTKKAFDYMAGCFNFKSEDKKRFFTLLNHESSFSLNNKSGSGARCYGQITLITFEEISRRIHHAVNHKYMRRNGLGTLDERSEIYLDALNKCPDIAQKANIHSSITAKMKEGGKKSARTQWNQFKNRLGKFKNMPVTCSLSYNPYNCLLYAMYNMKINKAVLDPVLTEAYGSLDSYYRRHNKDPHDQPDFTKIEKDFRFPLNRNDLLTFKGKIKNKVTGAVQNANFIFKDEREAYQVMQRFHYGTKELGGFQVQKVPMFKAHISEDGEQELDSEIKWTVLNTAYNGGVVVPMNHIKNFLDEKRQYLSSRCRPADTPKSCSSPQIRAQKAYKTYLTTKKRCRKQRSVCITEAAKRLGKSSKKIKQEEFTNWCMGRLDSCLVQRRFFDRSALRFRKQINTCRQKQTKCRHRQKILNGESLSVADFKDEFKQYIRSYYRESNRREAASFQQNVEKDLAYLQSPKSDLGAHLDRMHKNNKNITAENKQQFLDFVRKNCP